MRIPIAANLESRNGAVTKGAKNLNCIVEIKGQDSAVRKRPGMSDFGLIRVGTAQMLTSWKGIKSVIGDYYNSGVTYSSGYTNSTTWNASDKTANVTLSGSNLVATSTAVGFSGVRSSLSISSGVWYFELTVTSGNYILAGFSNAAHTLDFTGGTGFTGYVLYDDSSLSVLNRFTGDTIYCGVAFSNTDVLGCTYDATNGIVMFAKNGVTFATTTVPAGTALFAYNATSAIATAVTANFAGAFTYTPAATSTSLVVTTTSLPFSSAFTNDSASTNRIMFKNAEFGWYADAAGTVTKIADVDYPGNMTPARLTVPGIVYLDTYFFVMDTSARIYNSGSDDPTSWTALGYTTAQNEPGAGVALGKTQNYVAAFKEYSVELFYDAANPVGSPLSPVESGFLKIGCASGTSVAQWNESLIWVSQSRQAGRGVHIITGIQNQKISTPDVERILNADDLATVHAYTMRLDGHDLYVLTLVTSNITLVYDLTSQHWGQWSTCTIGSSKSVSSITRSGTTATVTTSTAHGLSDGDPVKISGASQSDYNGIFAACYVSSTVFTIEVANSPTTPATGTILAYPYTETYFKETKYTNYGGKNLLLHESDGHVYNVSSSAYQDNAAPINVFTRTSRLDGGDLGKKKISRARVTADYVADTVKIRWSDDDSQTFTTYRDLDMSLPEPEVRRSKSFRRRSYELRHTGNNPLNMKTLELEVSK